MRGIYAAEAQVQAEAMLAVVEQVRPGLLGRLRVDPLSELGHWPGLSVAVVDETPGAEECSVAGSYQSSPPTLVVAASRSPGRRNFTVLHEFGHHLQQTDIDLGNRLFQCGDPDQFEEQSCDAFAAQILLPDNALRAALDPRGPTPQDVVDLFTTGSAASREACCVWAARHLRGSGVVVLLDSRGIVRFAAPKGFIPPAKRSDQSGTPLIQAALHSSGNGATRDETYIVYRGGHESDKMFGQARWFDDDYLVAILVTDNVPWESLAIPQVPTRREDRSRWWVCETCEDSFPITERCERCHTPRCPNQHCGCDSARSAKERRCPDCNYLLHPSRFPAGSEVCNDCR
ncbi:ImmA/IrrE family metallo-endopeptidase [Mycobacterium sp. 29Ha]|uniref:ImmA/IrrE family metallo-endopeptidase n=1 Tax=Mycobacterium sp. 29Ha TaxID=2939268 RepID=UPI002938DFC7|nr:ImmA/IrrE family metallo-endopeptidase [Mycobacterium sp. 29Ha]MDV3136378.1 ImmA/IrrE family metallo-endopeptidase [Mycobacterium sp. 29Ha]